MINFIIWLVVGLVVGGVASIVLRRSSLIANILLGMVGAVVAGYLLPAFLKFETGAQGTISLASLLLSIAGAVILVVGVYFWRRKRIVNDAEIEKNWPRVRSKIHVRWDRITDEDIEQINGKHDRFIQVLQERYHYDADKAEDDLQNYLRALQA